jgi:DNA-binding transcriptional LysR family regulator
MDEHKVKVFCTVAEKKSFSKASVAMSLTQPAVSLQIQSLEEGLGAKLFDRSNGDIILTKPGKILYRYAKEISTLYASADRDFSKYTAPLKGTVKLGASTTTGNYMAPLVISAFKKKFPQMTVNLFVDNTKVVVDHLIEGNIDLALVEGEVKKQKLKVEKLISDEMVVIMSPLHPWAKKSCISVLELPKEPFLLREEGSGTRQLIEKFFMRHGIHPQSIKTPYIIGSTESIKSAVEEGLGISIVSKWATRKERKLGRLKTATLKEDRLVRDFSIIHRKSKELTYPVYQFLECLKKYPFDKLLKC